MSGLPLAAGVRQRPDARHPGSAARRGRASTKPKSIARSSQAKTDDEKAAIDRRRDIPIEALGFGIRLHRIPRPLDHRVAEHGLRRRAPDGGVYHSALRLVLLVHALLGHRLRVRRGAVAHDWHGDPAAGRRRHPAVRVHGDRARRCAATRRDRQAAARRPRMRRRSSHARRCRRSSSSRRRPTPTTARWRSMHARRTLDRAKQIELNRCSTPRSAPSSTTPACRSASGSSTSPTRRASTPATA